MRLLNLCRPQMEQYGAMEKRIGELKARFAQLEDRDVTFQKFKD